MENTNLELKNALLSLGFPEKEVGVYLAILDLGKGTVSQISRRAGINRTTGYDILDSLSRKKLVSVSGKEPKQEYLAESPENITVFLKEQIGSYTEKLKKAEDLAPQLKSLHHVGDRPSVRFYEGKDGLIKVYEDTLTSHEPIRAYATIDDMHKALPHYFPAYYKRRTQRGIAIRGIVPKTETAIERVKHNREEARETALVPPDKFYFSPEINIYDDKVMIASWREKLGIIIESREIADAMKKIYELAWAEARRLDKEGNKDYKENSYN